MQQIGYRKGSFSKIRTCSFLRNESKVIKRWMKPVIYIYKYEIKKRENNNFTFHFNVQWH